MPRAEVLRYGADTITSQSVSRRRVHAVPRALRRDRSAGGRRNTPSIPIRAAGAAVLSAAAMGAAGNG